MSNRRFPAAAVPCLQSAWVHVRSNSVPAKHRRRRACLPASTTARAHMGPTSRSGDTEHQICWGTHPAVQPGSRASATIARARAGESSPLLALEARAEEGRSSDLSVCLNVDEQHVRLTGLESASTPSPARLVDSGCVSVLLLVLGWHVSDTTWRVQFVHVALGLMSAQKQMELSS